MTIPMRVGRGLVVISADGTIGRYEEPISFTGEGAPSIIDINGAPYLLYRYTLYGITGRLYGFIAAIEPPTKEECDRVARELFGPTGFGILRLERIEESAETA